MAAMDAEFICSKIYNGVQNSGLHFSMNVTPSSSYITIRKNPINGRHQENLPAEEDFERVTFERSRLEEYCVEKDKMLRVVNIKIEEKLENLHRFSNDVSKENDKMKDTLDMNNQYEHHTVTKLKLMIKKPKPNSSSLSAIKTSLISVMCCTM